MLTDLLTHFDPATGTIPGVMPSERRLSDMCGAFVDDAAYGAVLAEGDRVLYTTSAFEPESVEGALWLTVVCLYPGKIGDEYAQTKGHVHAWRPASEYYVGLRGQGLMLLEDEATGESRAVPLTPDSAVYVPGHTAHRTVNVGDEPLTYLCFYPWQAGQDYGVIAERGFRHVVVEVDGAPAVVEREQYRQG